MGGDVILCQGSSQSSKQTINELGDHRVLTLFLSLAMPPTQSFASVS